MTDELCSLYQHATAVFSIRSLFTSQHKISMSNLTPPARAMYISCLNHNHTVAEFPACTVKLLQSVQRELLNFSAFTKWLWQTPTTHTIACLYATDGIMCNRLNEKHHPTRHFTLSSGPSPETEGLECFTQNPSCFLDGALLDIYI